MFSNEGRALDDETLEYTWLLEVQLGKLSGKLTLPQLVNVVTGLETMFTLALDAENELRPPKTLRYCHHGVVSNLCSHTRDETKYRCPTSEDIKYRMTRVAIDAIDFYLIESGTALHAWISPIRLSTCNLHGQKVKSGVTGLISTILVRHFISTSGHFNVPGGNNVAAAQNSYSNTNTTGSGRSQAKFAAQRANDTLDDPSTLNSASIGPTAVATKKEDLNALLGKRAADEPPPSASAIKFKRDSDFYRRGSRDDPAAAAANARRSRESDQSHGRRTAGGNSTTTTTTTTTNSERDELHGAAPKHVPNVDADPWLEVGCVSLGPIIIESAAALPIPEHCLHLVQHK